MNEKELKISEEDSGIRLDIFLAKKFSNYSRAYIQKLIKDEFVFVNGKKSEKKYALKIGDKVSVVLKEHEKISLEPDAGVKFEVIFENKDFAVINKPDGLVVHPSESHKSGTLVNGILHRWPEIKNVGEDLLRPGIVHRLDKETSGVMVVAKTNEMFFWLKEQFKERKAIKKYTALVFGRLEQKEGEISEPIARLGTKQVAVGNGKRRGAVKKTREAKTYFKVKEYFDDATLVEAFPKTGRMHQIRVHMAHIGHPIVGDKKYASKKMLQTLPFKRQFLHASTLEFFLPDGKKSVFSADLPSDLKSLLNEL
ncbi:RluA family pseudouridine synthase [Candidatus Azambacteria bacterium]|nr:RluA family pseudouridine synthase [Candidatus Azambacteria bacterium]